MYRTIFWTLWEKARVGWFERIALKHVYYHMWNRSPVQIRCMRQGAQGWCTGMSKFWELAIDRKAWHAAVHGVEKSQTWLSNWTELMFLFIFLRRCLKFFPFNIFSPENVPSQAFEHNWFTRQMTTYIFWPQVAWGMGWEGRGGEGFRMGNTCTPMADSCQCMAKTTTIW